MTLIVILNLLFGVVIAIAIPAALAWSIGSSRGLAAPTAGRARRRAARPSYVAPRSGLVARRVLNPAR